MKKILARKSKNFRKHGIPPRGTREYLNFLDNLDFDHYEPEEREEYFEHYEKEKRGVEEQEAGKAVKSR